MPHSATTPQLRRDALERDAPSLLTLLFHQSAAPACRHMHIPATTSCRIPCTFPVGCTQWRHASAPVQAVSAMP